MYTEPLKQSSPTANITPTGESEAEEALDQDADFEGMSMETALIILARDGLDQPIENLEVQVEMPGGEVSQSKTNAQGAIILPPPKSSTGEAKVQVRGQDGKLQPVCSIDLAQCQGVAVIRSPKVAIPMTLKPHQQKSVSAQPSGEGSAWWEVNGALDKAWKWLKDVVHHTDSAPPKSGGALSHVVKESATKAGNPIIVAVGPECPNGDNLRLGRNNIYREIILKAAKHCGMSPQAIAALIDAEAAKTPERIPLTHADGSPLLDKKGKPMVKKINELWYEKSHNINPKTGDGAAGLTQFIPSTWFAQGMAPQYYLHSQFKSKNWVRSEKDVKGKAKIVFVLADSTTTDKPLSHKSDTNVKACLSARFNPEWSIMAAADYAKYNLKVLEKQGFKLGGLNDAEKAKLMYLMHHEGEPHGPWFIRNELSKVSEKKMRNVFTQQLGKEEAVDMQIAKAGGDVHKAYRMWLAGYIDDKFDNIGRYACDPRQIAPPAEILVIFNKVGGKSA